MHPNPAFRQTPQSEMLDFARARGFGILVLGAADGPLLAHVPFVLSEDGAFAEFHLARSNPIARAPVGVAVLAISGPDAYVSPDWYGLEDQVPTWNYVAVHLRGRIAPAEPQSLAPHLDRLSARFESRLAPKTPWTSGKMTAGVMERMMRGILPFRLHVEDVQGTWKLGQNKPPEAQAGAAAGISAHPLGSEAREIGALMAARQSAGI
ncbi:negative transcriptional regulator, PaiB family [Gemmobacter megaterium]|uniref:Negative transcriptional regulator, PaiB family n=1 Tax=Gemmobacter megaterium TaxID=1086013 RepID=A0A1N7K4C0_9RHOB|nr:FMN-binding negative transcriptional regulator [Gemmobacter megaterium]GGE00351.1 transcriptional regulator [Gemmobacter megaterium]SIS56445.1 negative transcriptional regulator, PaiB family [Gemmobacter megaterium]